VRAALLLGERLAAKLDRDPALDLQVARAESLDLRRELGVLFAEDLGSLRLRAVEDLELLAQRVAVQASEIAPVEPVVV
jgi:hypothetical protein